MTGARARRREATTAEILTAAWEIAREEGLTSLSRRHIAERVGMQAPSLYSYFESKNAIYDAMFAQGQRELGVHLAAFDTDVPVTRATIKAATRAWFEFCTDDPTRYQLLFQRTIPGFEPSATSYALAVEHLERAGRMLLAAGVEDRGALDLYSALTTGLTSQQIANDPGGDRWERLLDEAMDMFLDHIGIPPTEPGEAP